MDKIKKIISKHLKSDTRTHIQFIRYFFVGGFSTVVHFSIYSILLEIYGVDWLISQSIGFVFGLITNYSIAIKFVFTNRNMENKWHERIIYFLSAFVGFLIDTALLSLFIEWLGWNPHLAKVFSVAVTFNWNFFSKKLTIFK